ncbi:MAG: helicase HerA-like domain-containing protein [Planctomycetota bacterium]
MPRTKTITLGNHATTGKPFKLPLEVLTEATAVLGRRGSGKTNTGKRIVEGVVRAGYQAIVLDPLDVWWGLKASADGKGNGLQVLLIGDPRKPHTDLPLREADGPQLADLLVDERLPCVISTRHLSKAARRRFSANFLERFYHRKGDPRKDTPCLLAIDEASMAIPQQQREPDQARLIGAVEACVRQGRASGIGVVLIDQRPASVNKDVLTQVELLIVHQLTGPQDRKAIQGWIDDNAAIDSAGVKSFLQSLAALAIPRGSEPRSEAWVWSPAWLDVFDRVNIAKADTFDSSKTPKPGSKPVQAASVHRFDLSAIRETWDQVIEQAEQDDPKKLRDQLAKLKREHTADQKHIGDLADQIEQLNAQASEPANPEAMKELVLTTIRRRDDQWQAKIGCSYDAWQSIHEQFHAQQSYLHDMTDAPSFDGIIEQTLNGHAPQPSIQKPTADGRGSTSPPTRPKPTPAPHRSKPSTTTHPDLKPAHQKLLDALAWLATHGLHQTDRSVVAAAAGVSPKSSSYANNISRLSSLDLVTYPDQGKLQLTDQGQHQANPPDAPLTLADYHRAWLSSPALKPAHARLLQAVIDRGELSREDLAAAAGVSPSSSSFANNVSRLSSLGLIRYPSQGHVAPTDLLYPEGLE